MPQISEKRQVENNPASAIEGVTLATATPLMDLAQSFPLRPMLDCSCIFLTSYHTCLRVGVYTPYSFHRGMLKPLIVRENISFILLIQSTGLLVVFLHMHEI